MNKQDVVSDEVLETFRTIGGQYSAFVDYVCDPECDPIDEGDEGYVPIVFTQEWVDSLDFDSLGDDVGDVDDNDEDVYGWVFDRDVNNDDESLVDVALVNECQRLSHNYTRWI